VTNKLKYFIPRIGEAVSVCTSDNMFFFLLSFENPQLVIGHLETCWRSSLSLLCF